MVLEREPGPIYLHDLQRGIGREVGRHAEWQSVSAVVGADRRFCWSGKGMYSLFRHGRIPGVRTLAEVASFILLAADQPLSGAEIGFLMKWSGYRFQDSSLDSALNREWRFTVGWEPAGSGLSAGWKVKLRDPVETRARFNDLAQTIEPDFGPYVAAIAEAFKASRPREPQPEHWPVDELLGRWSALVSEGLAERAKRLEDGAKYDALFEAANEAAVLHVMFGQGTANPTDLPTDQDGTEVDGR